MKAGGFFLLVALSSSWNKASAYVCPLCADGSDPSNPSGVVLGPTGGNQSCSSLIERSLNQQISEEQCTELQPLTAGPCGCATGGGTSPESAFCEMCGPGWVMTIPSARVSVPDLGAVTCSEVFVAAQTPGMINSTLCSLIQTIVDVPCGCQPGPPTPAPVGGVQTPTFPTFPTPSFPTFPTPSFPTFPTPSFPTFPTPSFPTFPTPSFPTFPTPSFPTFPTPSFPTFPTPSFPTFPTPSFPTFPTPSFPTFPTPSFPTFPTPSFPTFPTPSFPTFPSPASSGGFQTFPTLPTQAPSRAFGRALEANLWTLVGTVVVSSLLVVMAVM